MSDWAIAIHAELEPELAGLLELGKALGIPLLRRLQEEERLMVQLVSAELKVNALQSAVVVVMRNALDANMERIAAVDVPADVLDG